MEVLKVLAQDEIERERHEARRKAQLDFISGLDAARMEGEEKGLATGEKIGQIHLCERLLQRSESPLEKLQNLPLEELTRLAEELKAQVFSRR
jgi:hypothetical protein